jgi:outer membrane PBP1 activator LpoA protein
VGQISLVSCSVKATGRDLNRALALLCIALFWLGGCTSLQQEAGTTTEDPGVRAASDLSSQGRYEEAGQAYLDLAEDATGALQQRYLIRAAREIRRAGQIADAQAVIDSIQEPINEENLLGWAQVAGDIAIARDEATAALAILARAPQTSKPAAAAELLRIRGEAQFRLGDPVRGTEALLEREVWLADAQAIADNQLLLWSSYERYGAPAEVPLRARGDPVLAGWLQLGRLAADRSSGSASRALALRNWQQANPEHPANRPLVEQLLADLSTEAFLPDRVALLLPLSGRQGMAGAAVRDGFMAAFYGATDKGESAPTLRVYDTATESAVEAYRRAVAEGAQIVVGPLLKDNVNALATSSAGLEVPTLALNFLPAEIPAPAGLLQFALSPEDEAVATAERGIADGRQRAIALAPSNDWGRRVLNSFATTYQDLGGILVDYRFYQPDGRDFSYGIQDVLLIGESRDRMTRLSANLGIDLGFEPRRRDDVDLIFLAAPGAAGKLLRPQLRFYYAATIPTYSTSAIYIEGARGNGDLNGILFPDMPWLIAPDSEAAMARAGLARYWPDEASRRARLFAMGYDAFHLASRMTTPEGLQQLDGATGQLYLASDGRIHRRLSWAKMERGRPVALAPPEPPPDEAAPEARQLEEPDGSVRIIFPRVEASPLTD